MALRVAARLLERLTLFDPGLETSGVDWAPLARSAILLRRVPRRCRKRLTFRSRQTSERTGEHRYSQRDALFGQLVLR